jgi:tRNA-specific 2-thiouridylase
MGKDEVKVKFISPQKALTPGQAAVFYEGDQVLGGGWIREVIRSSEFGVGNAE